jgi:2-oxoglutarate ferredoxin oxidoreductase subunit alpha
MTLNLLIGGAAGQGIDTTAAIFEKLLKQAGFFVYTTRDFMSRVRGGHNFILIRFGSTVITSHSNRLDGLVAMNEETIELHSDQLTEKSFILCDSALKADDPRVIKIDMQQIAKDLGNPRVSGSVAIGALIGLFGLDRTNVQTVLSTFVKDALVEINQKAVDAGFEEVKPQYKCTPGDFCDWMIISGNRALALGALAADVRFYSAYPMSPSTSIMEYLAGKSLACGLVVEQAEDEIAAINMAIGASFAGVRALTGTSGGGFSLKVEALGLAGMTEIPLVIANIQRPGPATGLPTRTEQSDLRFVISAAQGEFPRMVIALRNHYDAFHQTVRAFEIAERYGIPVILLSDQYLADTSATVEPFTEPYLIDPSPFRQPTFAKDSAAAATADSRQTYRSYRLTDDGVSPRLYPGNPDHFVAADSDEHDEYGRITESADVRRQMMDKRMRKLEKLKLELQEPILIGQETCETLLIGWGSLYGPLIEAVSLLNHAKHGKFAALVFGDIFPLPTRRIEKMSKTCKRILNVEQNATGQLAGLVREYTGLVCQASVLKYDGRQLTGEEIAALVIARVEEVAK